MLGKFRQRQPDAATSSASDKGAVVMTGDAVALLPSVNRDGFDTGVVGYRLTIRPAIKYRLRCDDLLDHAAYYDQNGHRRKGPER